MSLDSFAKTKQSISSITPLVINLETPTGKRKRGGAINIVKILGMKALMKSIFQQLLQSEEDEVRDTI